MFVPDMRDKDTQTRERLGDHAKAEVLKKLRRGDQVAIAAIVGTTADCVKKNLRYRPTAKSVLSNRIWIAAHRLVTMRATIKQELAA